MMQERIEIQNGLVRKSTVAVLIEIRLIEKVRRPKVVYPNMMRSKRFL